MSTPHPPIPDKYVYLIRTSAGTHPTEPHTDLIRLRRQVMSKLAQLLMRNEISQHEYDKHVNHASDVIAQIRLRDWEVVSLFRQQLRQAGQSAEQHKDLIGRITKPLDPSPEAADHRRQYLRKYKEIQRQDALVRKHMEANKAPVQPSKPHKKTKEQRLEERRLRQEARQLKQQQKASKPRRPQLTPEEKRERHRQYAYQSYLLNKEQHAIKSAAYREANKHTDKYKETRKRVAQRQNERRAEIKQMLTLRNQ
jgi:hypothetical protein